MTTEYKDSTTEMRPRLSDLETPQTTHPQLHEITHLGNDRDTNVGSTTLYVPVASKVQSLVPSCYSYQRARICLSCRVYRPRTNTRTRVFSFKTPVHRCSCQTTSLVYARSFSHPQLALKPSRSRSVPVLPPPKSLAPLANPQRRQESHRIILRPEDVGHTKSHGPGAWNVGNAELRSQISPSLLSPFTADAIP